MKSRFVFRILLLVSTLLFLIGSLSLSTRTRLVPLWVAGFTLLLLAAEIVLSTWRTWRPSSLPVPAPVTARPLAPGAVSSGDGELVVFSWILLCPPLHLVAGICRRSSLFHGPVPEGSRALRFLRVGDPGCGSLAGLPPTTGQPSRAVPVRRVGVETTLSLGHLRRPLFLKMIGTEIR